MNTNLHDQDFIRSARRIVMSPDEIKLFLSQNYPELIAEQRRNPDGWSFFLGPPQRGIHSNRILRACRRNDQSVTRLKLAVSSRRGKALEIGFQGGKAELRKLIEKEMHLFLRSE
jgi:hypothetical protein